ncbi:phasin [[Pseudomonas] carboxydohydrogena]|uniref:Phasin n=1 Tax=Afipia carboxydohydrogena TaxID=290 RepID=A0ABY8BUP1_AFICR|nr:phasin [[Pseudomonas] carboxydohydrogena]WEF52380.1 phasin [[Pseudomonas] carboxydohydrogena]
MSTQGFFTTTPFQIPEQFRAFAENGVNQARDGYQKLKAAAESNNEALEAAYASAAKGASGFTAKLVEIAQTNVTSSFDFAHSLVGVGSLAEAAELVSSHARKQFEALTAQSKEIAELGQKVATETVEPLKASVTKAFQNVA